MSEIYIGGAWVEASTDATFEATNPATGEVLGQVAEGTRDDADRAVEAAREGASRMRRLTVWERSALCRRCGDAILDHADELAEALSRDQGKPLHAEARAEVEHAAGSFHNCSEQIKWLESSVIPVEAPSKRVYSIRQPRGVYGVVTPWNFPYMIPAEYLAPGLAAGNAVVWVPAPTTSWSALALMRALEDADLPAGALNLVTGPGPVVGDRVVSHPGTDAVGFTGSPETGFEIGRRAAGKPMLLELGGNGPTIVLDDADPELAAVAAGLGSWFNAGQVCCATERILAHEAVHDQLVEGLVKSAEEVRLGDPSQEETTMGPLNNEATAAKNDRHLEDARQKGAVIRSGGGRAGGFPTDLYYQPTVIEGVTPEMDVSREESFGPVAPVTRVSSDEEILELANDGDLGLVGAVFTRDLSRAHRFAEALRTGIVVVNDFTDYWELHIPFGGASGTRSGVGRIGGKHAIMEMSDLKTICMDIGAPSSQPAS